MKGSTIQIVSIGAENIYTTSDVELNHFKNVYKRYNQFVIESMEQPLVSNFKFNSTIKVKINKEGDLMGNTYLQVTLPSDPSSTSRWVNRVGFKLIKKVELIIGSSIIDKQLGLWMYLWTELSHTNEKKIILDNLVGTTSTGVNGLQCNEEHQLMIPLQMFFCRHISQAIPLLKLYNDDVFLKFYFESKNNCIQSGTPPSGDLSDTKLWIDHIYLDENEKRSFINNDIEFIYETTEHIVKNLTTTGINNILLPFTNTSKELIYVSQSDSVDTTITDKFTGYNKITKSQLKINSQNVFSLGYLSSIFTNKTVPFKNHTGKPNNYINAIPFSIYPENLEPSGILNFKSLRNINLLIESNIGTINIFSFCYSRFRIKNNKIIPN